MGSERLVGDGGGDGPGQGALGALGPVLGGNLVAGRQLAMPEQISNLLEAVPPAQFLNGVATVGQHQVIAPGFRPLIGDRGELPRRSACDLLRRHPGGAVKAHDLAVEVAVAEQFQRKRREFRRVSQPSGEHDA